MAAALTQTQFAGSRDWSPAEVRDKLLPEDREAFERDYRDALARAAQTMNLDELAEVMEGWRRTAWQQHHMGAEQWHAMLDRARRIRAGERFPGARPWREVKAELGL